MSNSFIIKASLFLLLVSVVLTGLWLLYIHYYVRRKSHRLANSKYDILKPVMLKIASNKVVKSEEIAALAKDVSLRYLVYLMLCEHHREDLFPAEYFTREKAAESFLVNWLEFPTELGAAPDEIELEKNVSIGELIYFVFKYRTKAPHWAAGNNWMLGVSGPYITEMLPYAVPRRVFSRFNPVGSTSPEAEAQWVHKHVHKDN